MTLDQAFQLAIQHHQGGQLEQASSLYHQILTHDPNHAQALHGLGIVALQTSQPAPAVELFKRALRANPNFPEACNNLGIALTRTDRLDEAIAVLRRGVALSPSDGRIWNSLGNALQNKRNNLEAVRAFEQAVRAAPDLVEAYNNLGNARLALGEVDLAVAALQRAVRLRPNYVEAWNNLGAALQRRCAFDGAIDAYQRALELSPDFFEAQINLGNALVDRNRLDEAENVFSNALRLRPHMPAVHRGLGVVAMRRGNLDEAELHITRALHIREDHPPALAAKATLLASKGELDEAVKTLRAAIKLDPQNEIHHHQLGLFLLTQGDFKNGWEECEWRWRFRDDQLPAGLRHPLWKGENVARKTVLIHAEQGLGDTIQFIRYAPLLASRGARVVVVCQPALSRLLGSMPSIAQVVTTDQPLPAFDLHVPLMSLPHLFKTTLETVPATVPYLHADDADVAKWRERLARDDARRPDGPARLKVGIAWAGNPAQKNNHNRSIAPELLWPLFDTTGVTFYRLHKPPVSAPALPAHPNLIVPDDADLPDLGATAALIKALDLVITVDTSIAHLAGALAHPTWLMLIEPPDWRWLVARGDSPWYPTVKLFRQPTIGDWNSVIERVAAALR